jgi:ABC-type glycerol-3-phosphate transport system substrate-binding protein
MDEMSGTMDRTRNEAKSRRAFVQAAGGGLAALTVLTACSIGPSRARSGSGAARAAKGEISWQCRDFSPAHVELYLSFASAFKERQPSVTMLAECVKGDANEKLQVRIAAGDPPDVAFIAASQFQVLAAQKMVSNLEEFIKRDATFKKDAYFPVFLKGLQFKGQQYGLPFDGGTVVLYYNRRIFDTAQIPRPDPNTPMTWEAALDLARKLTIDQHGVDATRGNFDSQAIQQLGISVPTYYLWWFLCRQAGQEVYSPDLSEVLIGRPAARRALQWLVDVHGRYRVAPSPVVRTTQPVSFDRGNQAMYVEGMWAAINPRTNLKDDWDIVPVPQFQGRPRIGLGWASGNVLVTGARNPDGGWEFAKFLAGPEVQSRMMEAGNAQPFLKAQVRDAGYYKLTPPHNKEVPIKEAEIATSPAFYPHAREVQNMILPALDGVYKGEESLDAMIARLTPLINEKLREYKARFDY